MSRAARLRRIILIILVALGILLTIGAIAADTLGFGPTPGFGVLQMFMLLLALTALTAAFYLYVSGIRPADTPRSLQADIGWRLSATGLVLAYAAGLADLLNIGTHVEPEFPRPFVGPLQLTGLALGIAITVIGMFLYYTSRGSRTRSSMDFILNGSNGSPASEPAATTRQNDDGK